MIFPELMTWNEQEEVSENLPPFAEYAYDFENNQLKLKDGKHYLVYGNEALKIWIFKAIATPRFKHHAYTELFGSELSSLIGQTISTEAKKLEARRYLTESLMVNPYITAIDDIRLDVQGDTLSMDVLCSTIYNDKVGVDGCKILIRS